VPQLANMLEGGRTPLLPPSKLEDQLPHHIYGISPLTHAIRAMQEVLSSRSKRDISFAGGGVGFEEYKSIVGFDRWAISKPIPTRAVTGDSMLDKASLGCPLVGRKAVEFSITFDGRIVSVRAGRPVVGVSIRLSRKEGSYDWFKAWAMSAIRSEWCSMPIDNRIVESRTPIFWPISARTPEWVMLAGRLASDSVPPRLTASLTI
jgi:hypothetical protein